MIIDCHTHIQLHDESVPEVELAGDILRRARAAGVDHLCLLGNVFRFGRTPDVAQVRQINDSTLAVIARYPSAFFGLCFLYPGLTAKACKAEMDRTMEAGLRGVKLEVGVHARDKRLDPIMEHAAELDVPVLHHAWYKSQGRLPDESDPIDIADLAGRHPATRIVMAHLTGGGHRGVLDILSYPNVSIDTSGGQPVAGLVEYAVAKLGAERVLYGSDVICRDFSAQLARIQAARIGAQARERILWKNAARMFRLDVAPAAGATREQGRAR